ncbi:hypothetical protein [Trichlorobacter lovleyi]|uniref:hypothetical protein n=2 Tax=Trichlorobacter lovleyi TaxID=313985 RepID=UPI0000E92578|nr:hypothetical protein [Trichlorobacter lovleyi]
MSRFFAPPLTIPASHETEIMMEIPKHDSHLEALEPESIRETISEELVTATDRQKNNL